MCKIQTLSDDTKTYKPKHEMQDIFRLYGDDYITRHKLTQCYAVKGYIIILYSFLHK